MKRMIRSATSESYDVYVRLKRNAERMYTVKARDIDKAYKAARELAKEDLTVNYCQPVSYYNVSISLDGQPAMVIPVEADSPEEAQRIALEEAASDLITSLE